VFPNEEIFFNERVLSDKCENLNNLKLGVRTT